MADLTYSAEQIQRLLRCPVCLDRYQDPRLLPCQHTFCLRPCLEGVVDISTRTIRCPECRAEHRLPNRGLSGLPKNLTVISFLELPSPTNGGATSRQNPPANQTDAPDCAVCRRTCDLLLCPHCNERICEACTRSHASKVRQDITRLVAQIRRQMPRLSEMFSGIRQQSDQLKQNCEAVSTAIQDAIESLIKELKARQIMLKSELNTFLLGEQHSLRLAQETLEVEAATVSSFCDLTESLLQCPPNDVSIGDLVPIQHQCAEHLQTVRTQSNAMDRLPSVGQPRFACDAREALSTLSNFGELFVNSGTVTSLSAQRNQPSQPPAVRHSAPSNSNHATSSSPRVSVSSHGADASSRRREISRYLHRLPEEDRHELHTAQAQARERVQNFANQRGLLQRRHRNNSERMASAIGGEPSRPRPEPSRPRPRRTWNTNNSFRPIEMASSDRGTSQAEGPSENSPASSHAETRNHQNAEGESVNSGSSSTQRAIRRPLPAPIRFDIDISEDLDELADELETTISFRYSTGDSVLVSTPRNNYQQKGRSILRFGERGNGQTHFTWPRGVAVHPLTNDILVADSSNHRIQVFDDCGRFVRSIGSYGQGEGEIDCLAGIAVNPSGDVIIADRYNQRIQVFDINGSFKSMFGAEGTEDGQLNYPWGVACDPEGNIYVCDKENHRVQVYRPDGTFLRKFGGLGSRSGQFENPNYVAVSSDNKVYVTDSSNHRIQVFDHMGTFLFGFGVQGTQRGQVKYPKGIAVDDQGFVLVADSGNNRVQVFRQNGRFYCMFGSWGSENGHFKGLEGVAIMPNGNVVVSDRENHRIQVF